MLLALDILPSNVYKGKSQRLRREEDPMPKYGRKAAKKKGKGGSKGSKKGK